MMHIQLATSFDAFRDRVYQVQDKRRQCQKIISRLLHTQLAAALDWFIQVTMQSKVHRNVSRCHLPRDACVRAFVCCVRNSLLSASALMPLASNGPARQTVEKAMGRWRTPALSRSFDLWMEFMDICRQETAAEAHQLAKEEMAAAAAAEREQEQMRTKREVERRLDMCRKTIARMQHIQAANCFDAFVERVQSKKELTARCKKVLQRMLHFQVAQAWDLLVQAVEQLRVQRTVISRTLSKWRAPLLALGFDGWADGVERLKVAAAEAAHEIAKQELRSQLDQETRRGADKVPVALVLGAKGSAMVWRIVSLALVLIGFVRSS